MKDRIRTYRWLALAVLVVLLLSGCQVVGTHQQVTPSPFPLRDLLIDLTPYPPGWKQEDIVNDDTAHEVENLLVAFRYQSEVSTVSIHEILRYTSEYEAQQDFELILRHKRGYFQNLVPVTQLTYSSQKAQRTILLCTKRDYDPPEVHELCIALAQYGPYISSFTAPINKRFMSYTNFTRIVDLIDRRMATVLGS